MSMDSFHARESRPRPSAPARTLPQRGGLRLDTALVAAGLARSRSHAQRLIEEGRVRVAGQPAAKAAQLVADPAAIALLPTDEPDYVSRGGIKLAGALQRTRLSAAGKLCLDLGQSTGGFTDCLLQAGARRVVGIDVGRAQLDPRLAGDPRVEAYQGVNARRLTESPLAGRRFDLIVADLSFISLTLIIPQLPAFLAPEGDALLLVKPPFEVGPQHVGKGGIVRNPLRYAEIRERLCVCANQHGLTARDWFESPIKGGDGNREFFLHLRHAND